MNFKIIITLLFIPFSLFLFSDDAPSENVEIEVVEIIGSQEEALKVAGSASVITAEDLEKFEYTDIN